MFNKKNKMKTQDKRQDRRDSAEENEQLFHIQKTLCSIAKEKNFSLDLSNFYGISRGKNALYLAQNGELYRSTLRKRNKFYDSKTFDAFTEINVKHKKINLFFFCKSTLISGGSQDNICAEIGEFITNIKTRNNSYPDNNDFYVLLLDGKYWKTFNEEDMMLPKNAISCNSENFAEKINFFLKKLCI